MNPLPPSSPGSSSPIPSATVSRRAAETVNPEGRSDYLILCDHASNTIPKGYRDLGLPKEALSQHIALDIGAAAVTRNLSRRLDARAVLSTFSRLLIDPNRMPDDPTLIVGRADGYDIPGNSGISHAEVERRIARFHRPYQDAIAAEIRRFQDEGRIPALVSIHSFTSAMNGFRRPWQLGLLWNRDPRLKDRLWRRLQRETGLAIGDNEPYSGRGAACTLEIHGMAQGLPHVLIEIRQDLIGDGDGAARWSDLLAAALSDVLADRAFLRIERF